MPCGIVDEERGQRSLSFGSSYNTSDCMVEALTSWWHTMDAHEQKDPKSIHINMDNGPESRGRRTPFLHRMVPFVDAIGKPVQWLYYPPSHSKDNPIERCWGILELHWNGTQLIDVTTMLAWAKSMTWTGLQPMVALSHKVYHLNVSRKFE